MIFLDESGAHLAMTRLYGRTFGGSRLRWPTPYHRGNKFSLISAISTEKVVASLYFEESIEGELFSGFVEHCLCKTLEPRHKLIMDNVAFHKVKRAEELIKATGAEIIYLPPYSPDYSPIELMWSKIKSVLRAKAARTCEEFQEAINAAYHSICTSDLTGWFKHCGYEIK